MFGYDGVHGEMATREFIWMTADVARDMRLSLSGPQMQESGANESGACTCRTFEDIPTVSE
jgi:hypothetical protein